MPRDLQSMPQSPVPLSRTLFKIKAYPRKLAGDLDSAIRFDIEGLFPLLEADRYQFSHRILRKNQDQVLTLVIAAPRERARGSEAVRTDLEVDALFLAAQARQKIPGDFIATCPPIGSACMIFAGSRRGFLYASHTNVAHLAERRKEVVDYIRGFDLPFNPETITLDEGDLSPRFRTGSARVFRILSNGTPKLSQLPFVAGLVIFFAVVLCWGFTVWQASRLRESVVSGEVVLKGLKKDLGMEGSALSRLSFEKERSHALAKREGVFKTVEDSLPAGVRLKSVKVDGGAIETTFLSRDQEPLFSFRDAVRKKIPGGRWGDLEKGGGGEYQVSAVFP
ncbi:MAG: hypothetical protein J0L75_08285 [Spirochaetes bacterium]|nr:hypothetical protein [Spirochaetota bacterium]